MQAFLGEKSILNFQRKANRKILLNDVLHLTREEIENSKIEFNMQAGSGGQPFPDRWLKHTEEEKNTGTCKDCSYWGWYGKQRNFYPGQWVFSG